MPVKYKYRDMALKLSQAMRRVVRSGQETADIMMALTVTGSNGLFYGPPGIGKTLFASTVAKAFIGAEAALVPVSRKREARKDASGGQVGLFDSYAEESAVAESQAVPGLLRGNETPVRPGGEEVLGQALDGATRPAYGFIRLSVGTQEADLNGTYHIPSMLKGKEVPVFRHEFLDAAVGVMDEINRALPPVSSLAMEHLGEGRAHIGIYRYELPRRLVFLTMNKNGVGVFELDEAMYDRMTASVTIEFMTARDLEETEPDSGWSPEMPLLGTVDDLVAMWSESQTVPMQLEACYMASRMARAATVCRHGNKAELLDFPACCASMSTVLADDGKGGKKPVTSACDCLNSSSCCKEITGMGKRFHRSLVVMARGYAYLRGDDEVTVKHVEVVAPYVLRHRCTILTEGGIKNDLARAKEMVRRLMADARPAVELLLSAGRGALRKGELEAHRKGNNLLVLESLAQAEELRAAHYKTSFKEPEKLNVAALRKAIDSAPDEVAKVFERMLKEHTKISGMIEPAQLADPFFRAGFKNSDGQEFFSGGAWDELEVKGKADSDLLPGVRASIERTKKGMLFIFEFAGKDGPEAGEDYRGLIASAPVKGFGLLPVYERIESDIRAAFTVA
jgi:MoxR-like ATPase